MPEKGIFITKTDKTVGSAGSDLEGEGQLRREGATWYRWVQNKIGSAVAAGDLVCYDPGQGSDYYGKVYQPTTALMNHLAGVCVSAIPDDGWGWILVEGYAATIQILVSNTSYAASYYYAPVNAADYASAFAAGGENQFQSSIASQAAIASRAAIASYDSDATISSIAARAAVDSHIAIQARLGRGYVQIAQAQTDSAASVTSNVAGFVHCLTV